MGGDDDEKEEHKTNTRDESNIDDEERDAAVLCRNAHCLGSLLQSWVVESFLEVQRHWSRHFGGKQLLSVVKMYKIITIVIRTEI